MLGILDCDNGVHMFLLHYVYTPRINNPIESLVYLGTITLYEQNKAGPQYRYGLMVLQIEKIGLYVM